MSADGIHMIRIYVDMVADLFHYGHVEFLKKARSLGDHLLVGIHSDKSVASYKRSPILTMEERMACIIGCRYVDEVVPDAPLNIDREWIELHRISLVVHGDDWSEEQLKKTHQVPMHMGILRTVPYTQGISTSEIIQRCKQSE